MNSEAAACIGEAEIRELIPHSGSMCVLDGVKEWDGHSIVCTSNTHLDRSNPLRRDEHLSAIHAFEYAAQAVAIHGGLCARSAGSIAPPGYLAALRDASIPIERLDHLKSPLEVRAQCLFGDSANSVYECHVSSGEILVAHGRVTIILRTATPAQKITEEQDPSERRRSVLRTSLPVEEIQRSISPEHPSLPGHFPGDPMVPGVIILDEVAAVVAKWRHCRITRIYFAKFLRPLRPGQAFIISLSATDSTLRAIDFQCRVKDHLFAEGRLEVVHHV